jgi:uncharacterized protein (TIGR03435 family)
VHGQLFEVATVKPTPAENAGPVEPSIVQFLPNGFRRTNSTLRTLVRTAYDVQEYQVIAGPGWADQLRFDVEARFDGTFTRDQVLRMLQTLLGERFTLKVRRETREGDIFALTVANDRSLGHRPSVPTTFQRRSIPGHLTMPVPERYFRAPGRRRAARYGERR